MENVQLEHTSSCGSLTKLTLIAKHGEIMGDKLQKKPVRVLILQIIIPNTMMGSLD